MSYTIYQQSIDGLSYDYAGQKSFTSDADCLTYLQTLGALFVAERSSGIAIFRIATVSYG